MRLTVLGNVCLALAVVALAVQLFMQFSSHPDAVMANRLGFVVVFFMIATVVLRYLGRRSTR